MTSEYPDAPGARRSGISTYAELLTRSLLAEGWEVTVLHFLDARVPPSSDLPPALPVTHRRLVLRHGGILGRLCPGLLEGLQLALFAWRLDRSEHFDALEGQNYEGFCWATALLFGGRFRMRMHTSLRQHIVAKQAPWSWTRRFGVWLDGFAARRTHGLVTHTRAHAEALRAEYGLGARRIEILPHATPGAPQTPFRSQPRCVGYIGGLELRKGADLIVGAIPAIAKAMPEVSFVMIGPDPAGAITTKVRTLQSTMPDLRDRIALTGSISDAELEGWWQQMDVLMVPSRYESFGLTVIEAFSRGVPVLCSDAAALVEVAGDAAMTVPATETTLATGAIALLQDPEARRRLAAKGRQRFEARYAEQAFREGLRQIYG